MIAFCVVHLIFEARRIGGTAGELAMAGFSGAGSYMGAKANIGL
jgi:hypothetical protein